MTNLSGGFLVIKNLLRSLLKMIEKTKKISTGSYDFNKWLYGGYECDVISMIAGPPGSGKTNFGILVACSQAKKGNKVIFIDTEGGFSVERVRQIVGDGENVRAGQMVQFHVRQAEKGPEALNVEQIEE